MKSVYDYLTERASVSQKIELIQNPAIVEASWVGDLKEVQELLQKKVDPNSVDSRGESAVSKWDGESKEILELLLEHGADINHQNRHGETVLHNLAHNLDEDEVKYLISLGADKAILNNGGTDACLTAYYNNNSDIMDILRNQNTCEILLQNLNFVDSVNKKGDKFEVEVELDYLMELFKEYRNTLPNPTIEKILNSDFDFDLDYDIQWYHHKDNINEENLELLKTIAKNNGWDEEEENEMWNILEESYITSEITTALNVAHHDAEFSDITTAIEGTLENSGWGYDYDTKKATTTLLEQTVWEKMKEGEISEIDELFEQIEGIYSPDSYYDEDNFNDLLKERLLDII